MSAPTAKLVYQLAFPACWDGKHLDSPDHKSHVPYTTVDGKCSGAYPVAEFDGLLFSSLRARLRQSLLLRAGERASGGAGEARGLATAMEKAGSVQLALLDGLDRLYGVKAVDSGKS